MDLDGDEAEHRLSMAYDSQPSHGYRADDDDDDDDDDDSDALMRLTPCASPPLLDEQGQGHVDDGLEQGWSVVSVQYSLVQSPRGGIYSRNKAETIEDQQRQQQEFNSWLIETNQATIPGADWSIPSVIAEPRPLPPQDPNEDVPGNDAQTARGAGRKRREPSIIKCSYIGCEREIDQAPLSCPSHVNGDPDYGDTPFCSYECMAAWASYEVGDPCADPILQGIDHRAGRKVVPAANWVDLLITRVANISMAPPIDSKGLRLEEDSSSLLGCRTHEARLLPDDATIQDGDMAEAMEDDGVEADEEADALETHPGPAVPCRSCAVLVAVNEAVLRISLRTSATWAFCSESCVLTHPEAQVKADSDGGLITLWEWCDLLRKGQVEVLRRDTWGSEPDDVDPDPQGEGPE
jgi:hypothetical protein